MKFFVVGLVLASQLLYSVNLSEAGCYRRGYVRRNNIIIRENIVSYLQPQALVVYNVNPYAFSYSTGYIAPAVPVQPGVAVQPGTNYQTNPQQQAQQDSQYVTKSEFKQFATQVYEILEKMDATLSGGSQGNTQSQELDREYQREGNGNQTGGNVSFNDVAQILKRSCVSCHSGAEPRGDYDMTIDGEIADNLDICTIAVKMASGSMPPKDSNVPRPTPQEIGMVVYYADMINSSRNVAPAEPNGNTDLR